MQTLNQLNDAFGQAEHIQFMKKGDLIIAELRNTHGFASVALQGAQVLQWLPNGEDTSVIWVSDAAVYQTGKGVRGGAPVCWPWFGAGEEGKPAHGFVRTRLWQVVSTQQNDTETSIRLRIQDDATSRAVWDYAFELDLILTLGTNLSITLETKNTGDSDFVITEALHTYFGVGELSQMSIIGLDSVSYLDKVLGMSQHTQTGNIQMAGEEVDRVYINTNTDVSIADSSLHRKITVSKQNATSTIVWNPGIEKEKGFADMANGDYRKMLCVESGTAGGDKVVVKKDHTHLLNVCYQLDKLA